MKFLLKVGGDTYVADALVRVTPDVLNVIRARRALLNSATGMDLKLQKMCFWDDTAVFCNSLHRDPSIGLTNQEEVNLETRGWVRYATKRRFRRAAIRTTMMVVRSEGVTWDGYTKFDDLRVETNLLPYSAMGLDA